MQRGIADEQQNYLELRIATAATARLEVMRYDVASNKWIVARDTQWN